MCWMCGIDVQQQQCRVINMKERLILGLQHTQMLEYIITRTAVLLGFFNGNVEFDEFSRQKWESVITFYLKVTRGVRVVGPLGHLMPNKKK